MMINKILNQLRIIGRDLWINSLGGGTGFLSS